jgi:hypothetical protein
MFLAWLVGKCHISGLTSSSVFVSDTVYQDLLGQQGNSEDPGHQSALWPTPEQTGIAQSSPQQSFPLQLDPYPAGGIPGHIGVPVPLNSVPETHLPGTSGGISSMAVTGDAEGTVGEDTLQLHPTLGKTCQLDWTHWGWSLGREEAGEGGEGTSGRK